MSDIVDLLVDDHRLVQDLMHTLLSDPRGAAIDKTFDRLYACLKAHTAYEETCVYALLTRKAECKDIALHGYEHHRQANRLLEVIRETDLADPTRHAKLTVLQEDLTLHFRMEESSLLPLLGTTVPMETLNELGDSYKAIRDQAQPVMTGAALPATSHLAASR